MPADMLSSTIASRAALLHRLVCGAALAGALTAGSAVLAQGVQSEQKAPPAPQPAPAAAPVAAEVVEDEPLDELPPITLDPPVLDFGIIPPSVTKEGVVKLINTGTKELEVLTVQPSCKCTTLDDISGKKIPVGGYIELRAQMKAESSPGAKRAEVKVLIDGYTQVLNVVLRNEVSLPVRVSPSYLNAVKGTEGKGTIVLESIDQKPFRICAVGGKTPNLIGFDPAKDEPRNQYVLDWDFARDFPDGKPPRYLIVETDRADCPLVDLFVRHESTFPKVVFRLSGYRHTFGRIEEGGSHEFHLDVTELPAGERIVTAATSSSAAKIEFLGVAPEAKGFRIKLRVTPNPGQIGILYVPFTIYSNQRQQDMTIWGQVVPRGHTGCLGQ
jgi:hypothetical protein